MGLRDLFKTVTDPDAEYMLKDVIDAQLKNYIAIQNQHRMSRSPSDHHMVLGDLWASRQRVKVAPQTPLEFLRILGFLTTAAASLMDRDDACVFIGCQFYLIEIQQEDPYWSNKSTKTIAKAKLITENIINKYMDDDTDNEELEKRHKKINPESNKLIKELFKGRSFSDFIFNYNEVQAEIMGKYFT